jgi:hypothetical protein
MAISPKIRGRIVEEISFNGPLIAGAQSLDYFGDGSFYLVDMPGVSIINILMSCIHIYTPVSIVQDT